MKADELILEVHRMGRAPHVSVHEATIDLGLADVELRIGCSTVTISRNASDPDRVELQIHAMWIMVGLAIALDGLVPRWVGVSWAILVACVVEGLLGAVLGLPRWLSDLSPFERVPQLPAASLTFLPLLVMSAIAAGLTLIGLIGLRRRDIGRI